jgi:hypothetical protein
MNTVNTVNYDDRVICTASISPLFLPRTIGSHRWLSVESQLPHARPGVRVLIARHREERRAGFPTITDYIIERLPHTNRYGGWSRITLVYAPGDAVPPRYRHLLFDATRVQARPLPPVAPMAHSSNATQLEHNGYRASAFA